MRRLLMVLLLAIAVGPAWGAADQTVAKKFYSGTSPTTLAQCCPYDTPASGTANLGLDNNTSQEWLFNGPKYRIRQSSTVKEVNLYVGSVTDLTALYIKVWRKNGSTYDLVGSSENILAAVTPGVGNTIRVSLSSPITGVQEGDYYGIRVEGSASAGNYQFFARTSQTLVTAYSVVNSTPGTSGFAWESQTATAGTVVPIELYTDSPLVVFIGDSLIAGCRDHWGYCQTFQDTSAVSHSLEYRINQLRGYSYQNCGVPSANTTDIANVFPADVVAKNPAVAVINGGINDVLASGTQNQHIARWTTILNYCRDYGIVPVVVLMWPDTAATNAQMTAVDAWNAALVTLCASYPSAIIIDAMPSLGQFRAGGTAGNLWDLKAAYDGGDGIHLNAAGYSLVGDLISNALAPYDTAVSPGMWKNPRWFSQPPVVAELLTNPSFETGDSTGWAVNQNCTLNAVRYNAQAGNFAMRLDRASSTTWSMKQTLEAGASVTGAWYRYQMMGNRGNTDVGWKIFFYNNTAGVTYYAPSLYNYDTAYTRRWATARAADNTGWIIGCAAYDSVGTSKYTFADNVSLGRLPFSSLVNCTSCPGNKFTVSAKLFVPSERTTTILGCEQVGLILNSDCSFAATAHSDYSINDTNLTLDNVTKAITATSTVTIAGVTYSLSSAGSLVGGSQSVVLSSGLTTTVLSGQYVGINQDNANYCLAYHDGAKIHFLRVVNGVAQAEDVNAANTYADWQTLRVTVDSGTATMAYNGISIGSISIGTAYPYAGLFRTDITGRLSEAKVQGASGGNDTGILGLSLSASMGGGGIDFKLKDSFTSNVATGGFTGDNLDSMPGPGTRTLIQDAGNNLSCASGNLSIGADEPILQLTPSSACTLMGFSFAIVHNNAYMYQSFNNSALAFWYNTGGGGLDVGVQGAGSWRLTKNTQYEWGSTNRGAFAVSGVNGYVFINEELYGIVPYPGSTLADIRLDPALAIVYPVSYQYVSGLNLPWTPSPVMSQGFQNSNQTTEVISASWFASDGTLYAAIGNTIKKSVDGGVTWSSPLKTFSGVTDPSNTPILGVFVDSRGYLYASGPSTVSGEKGLFQCKDPVGAPTTWTRVIDLSAYPSPIEIWGFVEDSTHKVWAGTYGSKAIVYASNTSGDSFTLSNDFSAAQTHVHALCVDPSNDNIYATIGDQAPKIIGKYTAASTTWSTLTPPDQTLGCIATATARIFGYDGSGLGTIWRTTNDTDFTQVWQGHGDYGTNDYLNCFWMRKDPDTNYLYAGFVSGHNFAGRTLIMVSIDGGKTWFQWRRWQKTYSYDGPIYASNIVNSKLAIARRYNTPISGEVLNLSHTLGPADGLGHIEGKEWSVGQGGAGLSFTTVSGVPYVVGGHLIFTTPGMVVADPGKADMILKASFNAPAADAGSTPAYVVFRYSDASNYWAVKITPNAGSNDYQLIKVVAGSPTVVAQDTAGWTAGKEYTIHVTTKDDYTTVDYFQGFIPQNATKHLTATDAFNKTATKVGLADDGASNVAFGGGFGGLAVYARTPNNLLNLLKLSN